MSPNNNSTSITDLFVEDFTTAYKKLKATGKNRLLKYITSFYRRWYYSALFEGTILTPANLITMSEKNEQSLLYPTPIMSSYSKISPITFVYPEYTMDKHPVVSDLKIFLDSCVPDFELTDKNRLTLNHTTLLLNKVSIFDPFYVEYLTDLALGMNLIKSIPAIYSNKAQVTSEAQQLFELTHTEILERIFSASIELSSRCILDVFPINKKSISHDFILDLLKKPESTDDIFQQLYSSIGINIVNFLETNSEEAMLDDMYNVMISSTFYLGIIIDKNFFTIFGYYLKVINLNYALPCDFANDLECAIDAIDSGGDINVGMFSPCSSYTLTALGLQLLKIPPTDSNTMQFPKQISPEMVGDLLSALVSGKNDLTMDIRDFIQQSHNDSMDSHIYDFRIRLTNNKLYWKNFECPPGMSLHDLYLEIIYEFGFDPTMNYSFFPDLSENPFSEYTCPSNKRRSKKADDTKLVEMELKPKHKFVLVIYDTVDPFTSEIIPVKSIRVEIEFIRSKEISYNSFYPRVSKMSQAFKRLEVEEWF